MSLQRFVDSEMFTMNHLLHYLNSSTESGIQDYLVNKLYEFPASDAEFYLQQLFNLLVTRREYFVLLLRYFFSKSIECHRFALKFYWAVMSATYFEGRDAIIHDFEMTIVNSSLPKDAPLAYPPHMFPFEVEESEQEKYARKKLRWDYFSYESRVIETLAKISVALLVTPEDKREGQLRTWLHGVDNWIKYTRNIYSSAEYSVCAQRLFRGTFFPMVFYMDTDEHYSQIVRVLPEEAFCFTTKARVPIKVLLETVSSLEPDPEHSLFNSNNGTEEGINSEVVNVDIETLKNLNNKEQRFIGLEEYKEPSGEIEPNQGSHYCERTNSLDGNSVWGEFWENTVSRVRRESPFRLYSSWKLRALIVKGLDDLRQEQLAMQFIYKFREIFREGGLPLFLQPYEILVVSDNMGIVEFIPNTQSLHSIKRRHKNFTTLKNFFIENWEHGFEEAQKNFVDSLAAYSLVCYLINVKDRHNANILLDADGHLIHIDFGFFLTSSPGGSLNFETAPFKLTKDYIELMGGIDSEMYGYFKVNLYKGLIELRKNADQLVLLLELMRPSAHLLCLYDFDRAVYEFKQRLHLTKTDEKLMKTVDTLLANSAENWRTIQYDSFQRSSNGIL